jgi:CRP/FNR family transcriptional regulator, cyclic AMP receptor protein
MHHTRTCDRSSVPLPAQRKLPGGMRGSQRYGFDLFENCLACPWRGDAFFCNLPSQVLKDFDALTFTNIYPKGAILFSEGEMPRGIFQLCHGSVKLSMSSEDGKTLITRIIEQGEALGLSSTISGNPSRVTAETIAPSQVNFVRREDFLRFLNTSIDASVNALRQLSTECESGADRVKAMELSQSATGKLAGLLLSWCAERGRPSDGGMRVQVLMTHDDISHLINTSRETVTRLFRDLRDERLISIKGSNLIIHDKRRLERLVGP